VSAAVEPKPKRSFLLLAEKITEGRKQMSGGDVQ
jgi:hypothetical protein